MARAPYRGTTILETMVALAVMLIAALGTLTLHVHQAKLTGEARQTTEAIALARDMIENISTWQYTDARLANAQTGNDGDIGDDAFAFEGNAPVFDHAEADLTAGGAVWNGLPPRYGYERYWNVAYVDDADANGVWDAVRIAVVVRWRRDVGWRRVVLLTTKLNPAEAQ